MTPTPDTVKEVAEVLRNEASIFGIDPIRRKILLAQANRLDPQPMGIEEAMEVLRKIGNGEPVTIMAGNAYGQANIDKYREACKTLVAHCEATKARGVALAAAEATMSTRAPGELVTEVTETERIIIGNMVRYFKRHNPESGFYYFVKDLAARCKVVRP